LKLTKIEAGMDFQNKEKVTKIWNNEIVPVIYRKGGKSKLIVKLPYSNNNRSWLKSDKRYKPSWNNKDKQWEVPKSWFNDIVKRSLHRYNSVYIIQPYREQEICAPACWRARGHECQCSCMGEHHGEESPEGRWFIVADTFATKWNDEKLACRLLTLKDSAK
jgi:hypothetical protein